MFVAARLISGQNAGDPCFGLNESSNVVRIIFVKGILDIGHFVSPTNISMRYLSYDVQLTISIILTSNTSVYRVVGKLVVQAERG